MVQKEGHKSSFPILRQVIDFVLVFSLEEEGGRKKLTKSRVACRLELENVFVFVFPLE